MSRLLYLPQHRALSTRHPLALRRMRSTGCWVSADESQFWKFFGSSPGVWTKAFSAAGGGSTTRPLSCKYEDLQAACVRWLILYDCFQEFNSDVCYFLECVSTHKQCWDSYSNLVTSYILHITFEKSNAIHYILLYFLKKCNIIIVTYYILLYRTFSSGYVYKIYVFWP